MKTKLKVCAGVLTAVLATSANAGIVTEWSYDNQAGFATWTGSTNTATTADDVTASGNSSTGANDLLSVNANNILDTNGDFAVDGTDNSLNTSLTWGIPAAGANSGDPKSSLDIDSPITGSISTNDWSWADGTSVMHENWVITGDSLKEATLLDGLTLTPTAWIAEPGDAGDPDAFAPYFAPQLQFGINFYETPNKQVDQDGNCPNGEANYSGDNINGCGDIFEITGLSDLPFEPVVGADFIQFTVPFILTDDQGLPLTGWGDTVYYVTTRLSGLSTLPDGYECEDSADCFGFVTKEQETNTLLAQFKVSTVPEPAAIALFGLGLVATGFAGRRRRIK
ncbi:PEP-CTERM sorting domain-containing protein [Thalassotalea sp. LPB0316]|uniref:THxN family PEP-CTERM protein n=1 Tax=Thalassotalea sp. LPB0316 TaxID=2769490 RepID=UPI0018673CBE|nr:THxN family PEP-CTERM protein [Thalassotalea sp. LPB0316]QOL26505.1 PEP-CTERM sorting domain-containing protein [Thalassotalea sp. LPB0316]